MSNLASVTDGQASSLPITLIYGPPGSRKTQMAVDAPSPLILQTEFGLGNRKAKAIAVKDITWLYETIRELGTTEHGYKTIAIDSLDHLSPMIKEHILARGPYADFAAFAKAKGFGAPYEAEANEWRLLFSQLEKLRSRKGLSILLIAHSEAATVMDPLSETYTQWEPKLPKKANAIVKELCNIIGFSHQKIAVREAEDESRHIAVGQGEFVLELQPKPAFIAKNQYGLPAQIPMTWTAFAEAWKAANP